MAGPPGPYWATSRCCRDGSIRTPYGASPCSADVAHSQRFSRFRSDKVSRLIHDHSSGFYLALSAGNGEEAVKFVVPEKRSSGPLSAIAIRNFYSNLVEPLTLIDVAPTRSDEYRVRYTYVAPSRGRCDGEALVRTTKVDGLNLIDSIKAISGC